MSTHLAEPIDQLGALLNSAELARILGYTMNAFYKLHREGAFDVFKVTPAIGTRIYSKVLVKRYLNGEAVGEPTRIFGRKVGTNRRRA